MSSLALAAGGLSAAAFAGQTTATAAVSSVRVGLRPMIPSGARQLAATAGNKTISGDVALRPRNAATLSAYASEVTRPGSQLYGHYLTLAEFRNDFAPSRATVRTIETELRAGGLTVSSVSGNRLLVGFTGSVSAAEATFHTSLANYRLANGRTVYANTSAISMRTSVSSAIRGVIGLNNLVRMRPIAPIRDRKQTGLVSHAPKPTAPAGAAKACGDAASSSAAFGGLTVNQLAYAYGLNPLYARGDFGQGQTVDILDLYNYVPSDIKAFDTCYYGAKKGAAVFGNDSVANVDGGVQKGAPGTGSVETEIDTDAVNGYAPGAKVVVYEGPPSNPAFLDIEADMADSSAKIASISYGGCELSWIEEDPGFVQEENYILEQDAALGKTVFVSTGDGGSEGCGIGAVYGEDPSTQPYVTAVGGTATTAATNPPQEDVWNNGVSGGAATGGISTIWRETGWQQFSAVPGMNNKAIIKRAENLDQSGFCTASGRAGVKQTHYSSAATYCREVPDVSAQADPNTGGMDIVVGGQWQQWGGTSLASPIWAGIAAVMASTPSCVSNGGLGFLPPKLYGIASSPSEYAASFTDVTLGYNDNDGAAAGLFPATKGYDMASGLGTPLLSGPNGAKGLAYYACAKPASAPTVSSVSPKAISSSAVASGTTLRISGSSFKAARAHGDVTVDGVTIGAVVIPASDLAVSSGSIKVSLPTNLLKALQGNGYLADGTGTYDVTVTLSNGETSVPSSASRVIFYDPGKSSAATPQVDGTYPPAGVTEGGTAVTVYGSGFSEGTIKSVTFGGKPAKSFKVVNDGTIKAVTPTEPAKASCVKGDHPAIGTCQVQVRVTGTGGSSPEPPIPLEGSGKPNFWSGFVQAPNEYDYEPTPVIKSISLEGAPVASESGGTIVQLTGKGFGTLGLLWVNVGPWQSGASDDDNVIPQSGTVLDVLLPPWQPTTAPTKVPVTVQTWGSPNLAPGETLLSKPPSNAVDVVYGPTPAPSKVTAEGSKLEAGPTSGGQTVTITGAGLDYTEEIGFVDPKYGFEALQDYVTNVSNNKITFTTPAALPGVYYIEVCNISNCTKAPGEYTYYLPGNPSLTSASPASGKAGTTVTVNGYNLGFIKAVYFGTVKGTDVQQPAYWESGNTNTFTVKAPKEKAGTKAYIQVETVESLATGYGKSKTNKAVTFTYTTKK